MGGAQDLVSREGPWLNLEHLPGKERASLKVVLQNLQKLCQEGIHSLPSALSSKIQAVQHIPLPALPERYPAASLLLSQVSRTQVPFTRVSQPQIQVQRNTTASVQNNKDPDSGAVTVCCPVSSPSAGALVVRLDPPDCHSVDSKHKVSCRTVNADLAHIHDCIWAAEGPSAIRSPVFEAGLSPTLQVARVQLKLAPGEVLLDMAAMQMSGAWLTLLLASQQNMVPSALKLVPLSAVLLEQLPITEVALLLVPLMFKQATLLAQNHLLEDRLDLGAKQQE